MLSPPSLAWATTILTFVQTIYCYGLPQSQQIAIGPMPAGNVPFPLQGLGIEDTERAVYDPGEDLFKSSSSSLNEPEEYNSVSNDVDFSDQMLLKSLEDQVREDQEIAAKSALLLKLLEDPSVQTLPIVYVEGQEPTDGLDDINPSMEKRSRYYRRYPWKRQNSRHRTYEADTRYLCVPSREDVFKLLVGIHENRNGNHQKTVNFCNRKRPAKAIFTNIRFLG